MYQTSVGKHQHWQGNKLPPGITLCPTETKFWEKMPELHAFLFYVGTAGLTTRVTEVIWNQNFTCEQVENFN